MIRLWFREPHRVNPARPRPLPAGRGKRPTARTVVPPISAGGGGKKNTGCSMSLLKFAVALVAVGLGILVFRYFAPVLLLAALPTREWRAAAGVPASARRHRLLRFARARGGALSEGTSAPPSSLPVASAVIHRAGATG